MPAINIPWICLRKVRELLLIRILKSRCMDFHRRMKHRSYGELDEEAYNSEDYPAQ